MPGSGPIDPDRIYFDFNGTRYSLPRTAADASEAITRLPDTGALVVVEFLSGVIVGVREAAVIVAELA